MYSYIGDEHELLLPPRNWLNRFKRLKILLIVRECKCTLRRAGFKVSVCPCCHFILPYSYPPERVKFTVICVSTSTGSPLRIYGLYFHCFTASMADRKSVVLGKECRSRW